MDREFTTRFSSKRIWAAIVRVVDDASCKLAVHLVLPACFRIRAVCPRAPTPNLKQQKARLAKARFSAVDFRPLKSRC